MAIFDEVRDVVVEQLSVAADAVKMESKIIEDLGADSLDVVELVMALRYCKQINKHLQTNAAKNIRK